MTEEHTNEISLELLAIELPETPEWEDTHFQAALWQYSAALDLAGTLAQQDENAEVTPEWEEQMEFVNDVLFLRDEIEEAGAYHGWHNFDPVDDFTPELEDLDMRIKQMAVGDATFMQFILGEYQRFRATIDPDASSWWWYLDRGIQ